MHADDLSHVSADVIWNSTCRLVRCAYWSRFYRVAEQQVLRKRTYFLSLLFAFRGNSRANGPIVNAVRHSEILACYLLS
jgi:hypothetical protein